MILDDVFSGLDATSEDRIFSRLLGRNGLLRQLGITVILVTHAAHRLSYADHIISLDAQGSVSEQGKFEQLVMENGYVAGLDARHTREADNSPKEDAAPMKAAAGDDTARQNAVADINRPVGDWKVYKFYFASAGWHNVLLLAGLVVIYAMLERFPGK